MTKHTERHVAVGFGLVFVITMLALAVWVPNPTPFQYTVFRIVLALAAAGVAATIPGFIEVTFPNWIRAGGGPRRIRHRLPDPLAPRPAWHLSGAATASQP